MENLFNIKIEAIYPHPDNPRKNIGDITELAASIAKEGIMQNLTVIPGHYDVNKVRQQDGYTVLIGHRRLAAAKAAGLTEVPCAIRIGTTLVDEVRIMAMENLHREDLTVDEQADSFQFMLDLGMTVSELSEASGFSEPTIRHRLKIAELDAEKRKKARDRADKAGKQLTMSDFMRMEKVESVEARNELLDVIGTSKFDNALSKALSAQEAAAVRKQWLGVLPTFATEVANIDYSQAERVTGLYANGDKFPLLEVPADAGTVDYFYVKSDSTVTLYKRRAMQVSPADSIRASVKAELGRITEELQAAENRALAHHEEFIKEFSAFKTEDALIRDFFFEQAVARMADDGYGYRPNLSNARASELLGVEIKDAEDIHAAYADNPERTTLIVAYLAASERGEYVVETKWNGALRADVPVLNVSAKTEDLFTFLKDIGYDPSPEEMDLYDGFLPQLAEAEELVSEAEAKLEELNTK